MVAEWISPIPRRVRGYFVRFCEDIFIDKTVTGKVAHADVILYTNHHEQQVLPSTGTPYCATDFCGQADMTATEMVAAIEMTVADKTAAKTLAAIEMAAIEMLDAEMPAAETSSCRRDCGT